MASSIALSRIQRELKEVQMKVLFLAIFRFHNFVLSCRKMLGLKLSYRTKRTSHIFWANSWARPQLHTKVRAWRLALTTCRRHVSLRHYNHRHVPIFSSQGKRKTAAVLFSCRIRKHIYIFHRSSSSPRFGIPTSAHKRESFASTFSKINGSSSYFVFLFCFGFLCSLSLVVLVAGGRGFSWLVAAVVDNPQGCCHEHSDSSPFDSSAALGRRAR